jgi:hypothetical protein
MAAQLSHTYLTPFTKDKYSPRMADTSRRPNTIHNSHKELHVSTTTAGSIAGIAIPGTPLVRGITDIIREAFAAATSSRT